MAVDQTTQQKIDEALDDAMKRLPGALPRAPRIVRLEGEPYEDKDGEPSLKIRVVYSADTTYKQIESAPVYEIEETVISCLIEHGLRDFPYFFFAREDELEPDAGAA